MLKKVGNLSKKGLKIWVSDPQGNTSIMCVPYPLTGPPNMDKVGSEKIFVYSTVYYWKFVSVVVFKCDWCELCFCLEEGLLQHKRICRKKPIEACDPDDESGGRPKKHQCEVCGRKCKSRANLEEHFRIHSGSKPFTCKQCGKSFTQQGSLTRHLRVHTKEQPYKCTECGRRFREKGTLTTHMMIHSQELPFICEVCGHKCREAGDLRAHMRVHTGEKPYKCELCKYQCKQAGSLKRHMLTHTGEKPFKCDVCGQRFTQSSNLNEHMFQVHEGFMSYVGRAM